MASFPVSIPSFTNPSAGNYLNSPAHATQHGSNNDETVAVATKIGTGSSTPIVNTFLGGSGTGTSAWTNIPVQSAWVAASDGATITFNLSAGNKQVVTMAASRILALSNVLSGHVFILKIIQGGAGSLTVTWFSTINWRGTGGSAPTLSTAIGAVDILGFIQTATDTYDGFIVSQS